MMMSLPRLIYLAQRLLWDGKREFRCSTTMWMKLIDFGLPYPFLERIANGLPFVIGVVTFRLETFAEHEHRLLEGARPSVPLIPRSDHHEDQ